MDGKMLARLGAIIFVAIAITVEGVARPACRAHPYFQEGIRSADRRDHRHVATGPEGTLKRGVPDEGEGAAPIQRDSPIVVLTTQRTKEISVTARDHTAHVRRGRGAAIGTDAVDSVGAAKVSIGCGVIRRETTDIER